MTEKSRSADKSRLILFATIFAPGLVSIAAGALVLLLKPGALAVVVAPLVLIILSVCAAVGLSWHYRLVSSRVVSNMYIAAKEAAIEARQQVSAGDTIQAIEKSVVAVRKQMREAIYQASESQWQADAIYQIIDQLPVGIISCDVDSRITFINERAETMLGYKSSELMSRHLSSLFPAYDEKRKEVFSRDITNKAQGKLMELAIRRKDCGTIPVDLTISPLSRFDSREFIASLVDISQRKELERLKKELIAVVSHDLKTPLTTVSANLTLLLEGIAGQLDDRSKQLIRATEREVRRLMGLIKDILDVEKMESGKFQLELKPVPLIAVLEAAEEAVAGAARRRSITVHTEAPDIEVCIDGERLVQVLVNLLSNAIKFSPEGSKIMVIAEKESDLEVKVIDQGRGIPPEFKEAVFEKFRQVTREDGRLAGGSGLGLPICKAIVEQHGGTIGFESKPGQGTTFWFRLPQ